MKKTELKVISIINLKDVTEIQKAVTEKVSKILNLNQIHTIKNN